jgi:hypothetical protein
MLKVLRGQLNVFRLAVKLYQEQTLPGNGEQGLQILGFEYYLYDCGQIPGSIFSFIRLLSFLSTNPAKCCGSTAMVTTMHQLP